MRKLIFLLCVLCALCGALFAQSLRAQSTFLELGLYWGSFSGAQVTNATTTIANSKGVLATATGAWPHVSLPVAFDVYTIHVTAPAANGHPALNYSVTMPLASSIPGTSFIVTNYTAKFAFNSDGKTGTFALGGGGSF